MTPSLSEVIARVEHTLYYGYNEDLLTHDIHTLIDAARQAEAWREVALAERERCECICQDEIDRGDKHGEPKYAAGARSCRDDIRALPAPEPKGLT